MKIPFLGKSGDRIPRSSQGGGGQKKGDAS